MLFNLATLDMAERQRIEQDKQAAYLVWQLKQGKIGPEQIIAQQVAITDAEAQDLFVQSIEKYKQMMGLV